MNYGKFVGKEMYRLTCCRQTVDTILGKIVSCLFEDISPRLLREMILE